MRLFWPLLMILCFGVFDMVSTYIVFDAVDTIVYETGLLPNLFYSLGGMWGLIAIKMLMVTLCAFALYIIAKKIPQFDRMCTFLCLGASLVGVMLAISNLNGAFTGSTIFILGIGIDKVAYTVFTIFFILGTIDLLRHYSSKKIDAGKPHTR